jgi:hypothetical protein
MLGQPEVIRHLLELALLDGRAILAGNLRIEEVSRRNCSSRVECPGGPCYFVKQGTGDGGELTVAREASIYRLLHSPVPPGRLQQAIPPFHGYDESRRVLVLGYEPGSPVAAPPPWPLSLHRPDLRTLRGSSGANLELIRMIQRFPEFCSLLDALRAEWRPISLIHFDLKSDNCVIVPAHGGSSRGPGIRIVDWELAGPGDPCWDVGSIFSDYLGLWLLSIPVLADTPPERFLELTRFPLERMRPAIRAFWGAYARERGLPADETREALLLAVRYSAARLLQTAFEQMQSAPRVTGNIVCLLQLSWNILERPAEAATRLLGLPA